MNFSGSDWALIITALTGFLGMLGTQIASLVVSIRNTRHLTEAKVVADQTKAVVDTVQTQTNGIADRAAATSASTAAAAAAAAEAARAAAHAVTNALAQGKAQGTAQGNLAGRKEQTAELKAAAKLKKHATKARGK